MHLTLMVQHQPPTMRETPCVWRFSVLPSNDTARAQVSSLDDTKAPDRAPFCLHLRTGPSVGGLQCLDCGSIVAAAHGVPELSHRAPPVLHHSVETPPPVADSDAAARREFDEHVRPVVADQPREVLHHAWGIFQRVFMTQGMVTGKRARALVLVSLLYSSRLLHGDNPAFEEVLLQRLAIPTRAMNKAFTMMAAVTLRVQS